MVSSPYTARREDGQATVEFAIVIPLLLLLVVGIFEFGKAFNYWIDLNHLANEGARWAAVNKVPPYDGDPTHPDGNPAPSCPEIKAFLLSQMNTGDLKDKVTAANITLKVDIPPARVPQEPQIGDAVRVWIKAPGYKIASLGEAINLGTVTLGGASTMRLEQVPSWTTSGNPC